MSTSEQRSNSDLTISKAYLKWSDYGKLIDTLCYKIKQSGLVFDAIHGIPRGGLIPGVAMSHYLEVPFVYEKYELSDYQYVLLVEDIVDTGKTIRKYLYLKDTGTKLCIASVFKHARSTIHPDFYARENNRWIVFPYEK